MKRTALVTGASAGVGETVCHPLVVESYRVIGAAKGLEKLMQLK